MFTLKADRPQKYRDNYKFEEKESKVDLNEVLRLARERQAEKAIREGTNG